MKKTVLSMIAGAALLATPAFAADMPVMKAPVEPPPPPGPTFDVAIGGSVMSDYNFRGISQSDRGPSAGAYFEAQYWWLYAGIAGYAVKLPTDPSAEIDFYGGIRPVIGNLTLDFGVLYYYYPKEIPGTNTDFVEPYFKASYKFNDYVTVGGGVFYGINWLQTGADGTYVNGTIKLTAPSTWFKEIGAYLSAEVGGYFFSTPDPGLFVYDYTTWNIGGGFTWKALTLDLRYYDTNLKQYQCALMAGGYNWCDATFIAKLSFDTTISALK